MTGSEDGNTWTDIGTTRKPSLSTRKLDMTKRYHFRMYATNPKGNFDYCYYNRGYLV